LPYKLQDRRLLESDYLDKIDTIVEMAITYTLTVLRIAPQHFDVARAGLERLRHDLALDVTDHPAAERLRSFLETLEIRVAERSFH
jgi:hypothetical protein